MADFFQELITGETRVQINDVGERDDDITQGALGESRILLYRSWLSPCFEQVLEMGFELVAEIVMGDFDAVGALLQLEHAYNVLHRQDPFGKRDEHEV